MKNKKKLDFFFKTFKENKNTLLQKAYKYVSNTNIPLESRWKVYKDLYFVAGVVNIKFLNNDTGILYDEFPPHINEILIKVAKSLFSNENAIVICAPDYWRKLKEELTEEEIKLIKNHILTKSGDNILII